MLSPLTIHPAYFPEYDAEFVDSTESIRGEIRGLLFVESCIAHRAL